MSPIDQPTSETQLGAQAPAAPLPFAEEQAADSFPQSSARAARLREAAQKEARAWQLSPKSARRGPRKALSRRLRQAVAEIEEALREIARAQQRAIPLPNSVRWLTDHARLVRAAARDAHQTLRAKYPPRKVRSGIQGEASLPLPYVAAAAFLQAVSYNCS